MSASAASCGAATGSASQSAAPSFKPLFSSLLAIPTESQLQSIRNLQKAAASSLTTAQTQCNALQTHVRARPQPDSHLKHNLATVQQIAKLESTITQLRDKLKDAQQSKRSDFQLIQSRIEWMNEIPTADRTNEQQTKQSIDLSSQTKSSQQSTDMTDDDDEKHQVEPESVQNRSSNSDVAAATTAAAKPTLPIRLSQLMIDYMLRSGKPQAASQLAESLNLNSCCDMSTFRHAHLVTSALFARDLTPALAWCGQNRSRLKSLSSCTLEFDLRIQEFVQLVMKGASKQAILHARKYLALTPDAAPVATAVSSASISPVASAAVNGSLSNSNSSSSPVAVASNGKANGTNTSNAAVNGGVSPDDSSTDTSDLNEASRRKRITLREAMNILVFYHISQKSTSQDQSQANGTASSNATAKPTNGDSANSIQHAKPPAPNQLPLWHKYASYWAPERWTMLQRDFLSAHLSVNGLPHLSPMHHMLQSGLSAIKTQQCQHACEAHAKASENESSHSQRSIDDDSSFDAENESALSRSTQCPICSSPLLLTLSRDLPSSCRTHSVLVCPVLGCVMDERNPPFALPNGEVYCKQAIFADAQASHDTAHAAASAQSNNGSATSRSDSAQQDVTQIVQRKTVTSVRTGQVFDAAQCRQAYVL